MRNVPADILESRMLMSAATSAVLNAPVRADQLQIRADLLKFRLDCVSASGTIMADILKIKSDDPKQSPTITPLVKKMRSDLRAMWTQLAGDRLAEAQNVLADESVIVGDRLKILKDRDTPRKRRTVYARISVDGDGLGETARRFAGSAFVAVDESRGA